MRCAIYARKSADERSTVSLRTIDNQRTLCEHHILARSGEGWTVLPTLYEDEGWSGASLARPALDRLLADIDAGEVDAVVVYKLDRLSRSLSDFLALLERFEGAGVAFVSTTQSFDTATSVGRLTLNILLSFAQFERELIGERTRDWVAGARRRGIWTSGPVPYGYQRHEGRLRPHEERAAIVRWSFRRFLKVRCFGDLALELNAAGHRNRFGRTFDGRTVKVMIENRVYLGEMSHRGETVLDTHEPIIGKAAWRKAQQVVAEIRAGKYGRMGAWQRDRMPRAILDEATYPVSDAFAVTNARG